LTWNKIFNDMDEYFATCSWMKDIQGWQFGWQMKLDDFFHEHWQHTFLQKIEQKNKVEKNYVGWFWKIRRMKCSNHISYFLNMKYIKLCSI
jgi:hypothetical protein